jgi:hypothetical protein
MAILNWFKQKPKDPAVDEWDRDAARWRDEHKWRRGFPPIEDVIRINAEAGFPFHPYHPIHELVK